MVGKVLLVFGMILLNFVFPWRVQGADGKLVINLPSRTIEYYRKGELICRYPVAIGKPSTPTPLGRFYVVDKELNPSWYPPERMGMVVPSGPDNPLGYRWMGIGGNYGIHGTNMPWSIGTAASNGCIRMFEEQVEKLFDLVEYNTPVQITYDRAKIEVDKQGEVWIGIYPDIYGYKSITLYNVKSILAAQGVVGVVDDKVLAGLIQNEAGEQTVVARVHKLKVNNHFLTQWGISVEGNLYVPIVAIAESIKANIAWDRGTGEIIGRQHRVPGLLRDDILYTAAENVPLLFGGQQSWQEEDNCLVVTVPSLWLAGTLVSSDIENINGRRYIPLRQVAEALGKKCYETEDDAVWLGMQKVPVTTIGGAAYINTEDFSQYFQKRLSWQEETEQLQIEDLPIPLDYSMYIGEMGNFTD